MKIFCSVLFVMLIAISVFGQTSDTTNTNGTKPKIFIDGYSADFDQVRKVVNFVDYVRDRQQADIYLMVTGSETGIGHEITLTFTGKKSFSNIDDTLNYHIANFDSDDLKHIKFINTLKRGLVRYINKTELAGNIEITYNASENAVQVWDDPWDSWVFRLRLGGSMNGEKSQESYDIYSEARITRITKDWKIRFNLNANYNEDRYSYDGENLISSSSSKSFSSFVAKSISNHFSLGLDGFAVASTYENVQLHVGLQPAIEYNLFPYSEFTYHEFRFTYSIGYNIYNYIDVTIYDKLREAVLRQELRADLEINRPWGEIDFNVGYSSHISNSSRNRFNVKGELSLNLFEGFSFDIEVGYSGINDQINIPQRDLTIDEVLLRRRQLETQYHYWGSVGFSYTFGSIYNNIVNTRFGD